MLHNAIYVHIQWKMLHKMQQFTAEHGIHLLLQIYDLKDSLIPENSPMYIDMNLSLYKVARCNKDYLSAHWMTGNCRHIVYSGY